MTLIQDEQVMAEPTRAYWTSVLATSGNGSGPAVETLSSSIPLDTDQEISSILSQPERDWAPLITDADDLMSHRSESGQSDSEVPSASADQAVLPLQTVIGTFESESRAQIAANYVASFEQIHSSALWVLAPRMRSRDVEDEPSQAPDVYWDDPYWEPVQSALGANRAVLIWILDEAGSSQAQAILTEHTGSLHTEVLPRPPRYVPVAPPMPETLGILSALPIPE